MHTKKTEKNSFTLNFLNENQKFNKQYYESKILRYQKKLSDLRTKPKHSL